MGWNHPQTLQLLCKRRPRCLEMRPSQHYIGPQMKFSHLSNFCRKKIPGLKKNFLHLSNESIGFVIWCLQISTPKVIKKCARIFFFCRNLKNERMSFLGLTSRHLGPLLLKNCRVPKTFQELHSLFSEQFKGQLISKANQSSQGFSQKMNKNTSLTTKNEFIRSFFGRILSLTIFFRD